MFYESHALTNATAPDDAPRLSPARAHLQRMAAAAAQGVASPATRPSAAGHEHELMLAQLYEHRKTLKAIQSVQRKTEAKAAMVPVYDAYLDGVLAAGTGHDDPILTTLMVWNIDAGRYERALQLARHVLDHGLKLPDQYQRDAATLLIDEFSTAALAGHLPQGSTVDLPQGSAVDLLLHVMDLTQGRDAPDQARAKLHKAIGYALTGKAWGSEPDYDQLSDTAVCAAHAQLMRAQVLFAQVGVKKDIERLERRLKKAGQEPSAANRADPRPGGSVARG